MADHESYNSPAEIRQRIGAGGRFSLNNVSGDITVRGVEGDEVVVIARGEGGSGQLPLVVRRDEGSLHIETDEQAGWLTSRKRGGIEFEINVPAGARVEIQAVSADINVHDLLGDQSYKTVSGDLEIVGVGGRVSATTVSGDVELVGARPVEVNMTTTSGDIEASAVIFQPVRLRTVSGDMNLRGGFAPGPQHTVESVSGDLSIEATTGLSVDTKRGIDLARGSNRPMVSGDGSAQLRFRSLSGDVQLSGVAGPPSAATAQTTVSTADSLEILRSLERGEIDVEEASRRLEGAGSRG